MRGIRNLTPEIKEKLCSISKKRLIDKQPFTQEELEGFGLDKKHKPILCIMTRALL